MDRYASVNDLEDDELDLSFYSSVTTAGSYTQTVGNIFTRHANEIRTATEGAMQPLHQIGRKKIRELIAKQNNEVFSFLQHPERTPSAIGIAETLFRRYGHDAPTYRGTSSISRELNVDVSMSPVLTEVTAALAAIGVGGSVDASSVPASVSVGHSPLSVLTHQLRWIFQQYKATGEEVQRLEALLQQKTQALDKLQQRLPLITNLTTNDAYPPLLEAFQAYLQNAFRNSQIETTYRELVEAYKKWQVLRELVALPSLANSESREPLCSVCITDPITHAIAPCGHTFCTNCVRRMSHQCYICRGQAREKVKLYFP
jgi:hypothetical protein